MPPCSSRPTSDPVPDRDVVRQLQPPEIAFAPSPLSTTLHPVLRAASLALFVSAGCASPGPPRPPSLHLPSLVTDLSASRVGNAVELAWTTPSETTDHLPAPAHLTAELCRTRLPSTTPICLPRVPVAPGAGALSDPLPPSLLAAPIGVLSYRVEIRNAADHSAGRSAEALAVSGPALPPVSNLHLTPVERGVRLTWNADPPSAIADLHRVDLAQPGNPPRKPGTQQPGSMSLAPRLAPDLHLRSEEHISPGQPTGATDTAVTDGATYLYTVQRLQSVTVAGHPLDLRSLLSDPLTITVRDTFPPRSPSGLAAIPTSQTTSATSTPSAPETLSIDLSWEPDVEPDLAGYLVDRATVSASGATGVFARLTPSPIAAPAFRDRNVAPGTRYAYRVLAVDTSGNQSTPSPAVAETSLQP